MVRKLDLYLVQIRQRIAHIECRLDFPGQYDVSPFLFFFFFSMRVYIPWLLLLRLCT